MSFYDKEDLEKAQAKIRESATKDQLSIMDAVSVAVDAEARALDDRLEFENKLRAWARNLCGASLDMTEIEELRSMARQSNPGIFYFKTKRAGSVQLFKTAFGSVDRLDRVDRYLATLERTVIDVTNNSQFTALGFLGLIKLAFKNLFTRRK